MAHNLQHQRFFDRQLYNIQTDISFYHGLVERNRNERPAGPAGNTTSGLGVAAKEFSKRVRERNKGVATEMIIYRIPNPSRHPAAGMTPPGGRRFGAISPVY